MEKKIAQLQAKREQARIGGGEKRIAAQHNKGKLTAQKELVFCWIRIALKNLICLKLIVVQISVWKK